MTALFASRTLRPGHPPRRAGRRALFARESARVRRQQRRRLRQHPRRLPAQRRRAPRLCLVELGVRRQHEMPFSVHQNVDHPLSFYAATKKANELMAHTYAHLYRLPATGLRFFTVYGPWGRPDMALFLFTRNILAGKPIDVFNHGHHRRDFTYVDDIVEGVVRACDRVRDRNPDWDGDAPGSGHEPRAVPALQHRQQPAGGTAALHRGARGHASAARRDEPAAAAARRRARHLGRHR